MKNLKTKKKMKRQLPSKPFNVENMNINLNLAKRRLNMTIVMKVGNLLQVMSLKMKRKMKVFQNTYNPQIQWLEETIG